MDRREAIKKTSLAMGGIISAPTLAVIMKGCSPSRALEWQPTLFTTEQAMMVEDLSERIIPATDTPGAKVAGVPKFIQDMVSTIYETENQETFLAGLNDLEQSSQEKFDKSFTSLTEDQQYELLNPLNEAVAKEATDDQKNARDRSNDKSPSFFRMAKELTVSGYYTSEIGATQELQYLDIPGNYDGCVPLEDLGGKTWAT